MRLTARSDHQTHPGVPSSGIAKGAPGGGPSSSAIAARYFKIYIQVLGVSGKLGCFQWRRGARGGGVIFFAAGVNKKGRNPAMTARAQARPKAPASAPSSPHLFAAQLRSVGVVQLESEQVAFVNLRWPQVVFFVALTQTHQHNNCTETCTEVQCQPTAPPGTFQDTKPRHRVLGCPKRTPSTARSMMVGQLTAGADGCLPIRSRCRRVYD